MAASVSSGRAQAPTPAITGCYGVDLGAWQPHVDVGDDTVEVMPPPQVVLLADSGTVSFEGRGYLVRPVPGTPPSVHRWSYWRQLRPDSVYVAWTTGYAGLTMRLQIGDSVMTGTAQTFWDFPREMQTASAKLTRIRCP
jgi:hypothetical protein